MNERGKEKRGLQVTQIGGIIVYRITPAGDLELKKSRNSIPFGFFQPGERIMPTNVFV